MKFKLQASFAVIHMWLLSNITEQSSMLIVIELNETFVFITFLLRLVLDMNCYDCDPGYYCPPISENQLPCESGYYSVGNATTCLECPAGYQCSSSSAQPCSTRYYSLGAQTSCTACPAGMFNLSPIDL